jgi:hypothetical protein
MQQKDPNTSLIGWQNKEMRVEAQQYLDHLASDFKDRLQNQSRLLAADDEVVIKRHVARAYRIITNKEKESWLPEGLKLVGSTLFGGGVMAFINESSLQIPRAFWLILYFTLALFGLFLIFLGFVVEARRS